MTGRSLVLSIGVTAVVCTIGGRCSVPAPKGLPAKTQARLVEHQVRTVIDGQRVQVLEARVVQLQAKADDEKEMREGTQAFAERERDRGDSLEARARAAATAADSALAWHAAHDARKREADSLRAVVVSQRGSLATKDSMLAAKDTIISVQKSRAARADSSIAELIPLAESGGDRCRILWVLRCPSRKAALIGGALAGAGAAAIASGKIKIRLPIG